MAGTIEMSLAGESGHFLSMEMTRGLRNDDREGELVVCCSISVQPVGLVSWHCDPPKPLGRHTTYGVRGH